MKTEHIIAYLIMILIGVLISVAGWYFLPPASDFLKAGTSFWSFFLPIMVINIGIIWILIVLSDAINDYFIYHQRGCAKNQKR